MNDFSEKSAQTDPEARVKDLEAVIEALMAERLATRAFAASLAHDLTMHERAELAKEAVRAEGLARRVCREAGIRLENKPQAKPDGGSGEGADV
jgi:hypothetical protein